MDKFGMSFGGGPSKKELLDMIESQKKQLVQYQTRFKDVVRAYKSLLKEKEALEASLKVLSVSQEVDLSQRGGNMAAAELAEDRCSVHSEDSLDTAASLETAASINSEGANRGERAEEEQGSEQGDATEPESSGEGTAAAPQPLSRVFQLKSQISTLTSSLATVTQEKSRMEASFQADKRKLKQELEELRDQLEAGRRQREAESASLQEQLAESKARVITQQHEREQEQGDHALMLRELQKLLQEERGLRQDTELVLEDTNAALLEAKQAVKQGAELQEQLDKVSEQRDEALRRLQETEAEKNRPDPRVEELQAKLQHLKDQYQQQVQQETRKAAQAEERVHERARAEELRAAGLEQRVSELSELLGATEKARQRDQQTAQRLRERLLQLDAENKTLAIAASSRTTSDLNVDEATLDVGALKEKLEKVKKLLLAAQKGPEQIMDMDTLEETAGQEDGEKTSVLYYQQELKQLREEFERYKLRAQVVLKNKNTKDGCLAKELEEVRDQLAELKEKYINLRIQSDEAEAAHRHRLEERQQRAAALQQSHRAELEKTEAVHRENLLRLEAELHKQRDRTMALLVEKDRELEMLRSAVTNCSQSADTDKMADVKAAADTAEASALDENDVITQALRLASPNEPTLLLYAEQLARKEVEISSLRGQKHCLEDDLHQLQAKLIANAEQHEEETTRLRGQLDKLMRDQRREGANLEYLKNILFKFLTLQDSSGRQQTLNAILTILHFSPQEKQAVLRLHGHTWWTAVKI